MLCATLLKKFARRTALSLAAGTCLLLSGCWGADTDKLLDRVEKAITTWHDRSRANCLSITDPALQNTCLMLLNANYMTLMVKYLELATAEADCQEEVFKTTIKGIQDVLKAAIPLIQALSGVPANLNGILSKNDSVNVEGLAQNFGGGTYFIMSGASATVQFEDGQFASLPFSGSFTSQVHPADGGGWEGVVTAANLNASYFSWSAHATLNTQFPGLESTISLAPDPGQPGRFVGELVLLIDVDNDWLGDPLWWITLPVASFVPQQVLELTTDGDFVGGTEIFPTVESTADPFADCNGNGWPDGEELFYGIASDANHNGVPDECDIASGSATDCDRNGMPDAVQLINGEAFDTNGNGLLEPQCEFVDCDGNGMEDYIDLLDGLDFNHNGLLDACETDCNDDGQADFFDIAFGESFDEDADGVPDECQQGSPADLDGDGDVDGFDLGILLGNWTGAGFYFPCPPHQPADLNGDCKVNGFDLAILLGSWGGSRT
jgi:uncharacterized protein YunC (DUF1805 family)